MEHLGRILTPENGWLEYFLVSFWVVSRPIFRCYKYVSFREWLVVCVVGGEFGILGFGTTGPQTTNLPLPIPSMGRTGIFPDMNG